MATVGTCGADIAMPLGINEVFFITGSAGSAGVGCISLIGAGGSSHLCTVSVSAGGNVLCIAVKAIGASICDYTVSGTTGWSGYFGTVVMTSGGSVIVFIAVATGGACMSGIALTVAGGGSDLAAVAMSKLRNGLGIAVVAATAGEGPYTVSGTSGGASDLGAIAVT